MIKYLDINNYKKISILKLMRVKTRNHKNVISPKRTKKFKQIKVKFKVKVKSKIYTKRLD